MHSQTLWAEALPGQGPTACLHLDATPAALLLKFSLLVYTRESIRDKEENKTRPNQRALRSAKAAEHQKRNSGRQGRGTLGFLPLPDLEHFAGRHCAPAAGSPPAPRALQERSRRARAPVGLVQACLLAPLEQLIFSCISRPGWGGESGGGGSGRLGGRGEPAQERPRDRNPCSESPCVARTRSSLQRPRRVEKGWFRLQRGGRGAIILVSS